MNLKLKKTGITTNPQNLEPSDIHPSQVQPSQLSQGPATIPYNPDQTIRKFRHKKDPTSHPTTSNDLNEEGLKHLDKPTVYRKLKHNATTNTYNRIKVLFRTLRWQGWIPRSFVDYCTPPEDYRTSRLYFLEKSPQKSNWNQTNSIKRKLREHLQFCTRMVKPTSTKTVIIHNTQWNLSNW